MHWHIEFHLIGHIPRDFFFAQHHKTRNFAREGYVVFLSLRPVGLMDKASASGAGDSRFESWADQYYRSRPVGALMKLYRSACSCGAWAPPRRWGAVLLSPTRALAFLPCSLSAARLAQSAERKALNLVVVGSSPTVGAFISLEGRSETRGSAMDDFPATAFVHIVRFDSPCVP